MIRDASTNATGASGVSQRGAPPGNAFPRANTTADTEGSAYAISPSTLVAATICCQLPNGSRKATPSTKLIARARRGIPDRPLTTAKAGGRKPFLDIANDSRPVVAVNDSADPAGEAIASAYSTQDSQVRLSATASCAYGELKLTPCQPWTRSAPGTAPMNTTCSRM